MVRYNLTANLWCKDSLLSLFYILDYPSFSSYHLELWLIFSLILLWHYDTMVLHFRIRITKHVTGGFWENIPKSSLFWPKCCIREPEINPIVRDISYIQSFSWVFRACSKTSKPFLSFSRKPWRDKTQSMVRVSWCLACLRTCVRLQLERTHYPV